MTKAVVVQFRRGRKTVKPKHFLLEVDGTDSKEKAEKFVGKSVSWKSTGKEPKVITGKIASSHGNKGVLRAIFERGLPGQAIGSEVEIK
jgi:large subunit ribosomal protein L35Ae